MEKWGYVGMSSGGGETRPIVAHTVMYLEACTLDVELGVMRIRIGDFWMVDLGF